VKRRDDDWDMDYYWLLHDAAMYKEAEEYCLRALSDDPDNEEPRVFFGHILGVHLERFDEAIRVLEHGLLLHPKDSNLNFNIARLCAKSGKYAEAEKAYKATLDTDLSPESEARVLADLADLYVRKLSRSDEGRVLLTKAISKAGNSPEAHRNISEVFLFLSEFEDAEKHARTRC
jgi:tetratricopeptide (TPR) repeat protein